MKPFAQWTVEEVEETFQLTTRLESQPFQQWMTGSATPSPEETHQLTQLQRRLLLHGYDWNEQELIVNFIGQLLTLVDFDQENYHPFLERELVVQIDQEVLSGVVDFVVAQGKHSPRHPYFVIHEYKKEHDSSNDPLGQLLIAMVAAQKLNNDGNPIYGAYVLGRYWHFVLLDGDAYTVHPGLNAATTDDLTVIFGTLKHTKTLIDAFISAPVVQMEKGTID
jgi:hypothetical protein